MFVLTHKRSGKQISIIKYDSDETVRRGLLEFAIYLVFLIAATIVANSVHHLYMFYFNHTMQKLFLDREIETVNGKEINFENIVTISDWWSFLESNFINGLHGEDEKETRKLLRDNLLLGPPRMRQMRVKEHGCFVEEAFRRYFKECYSDYSYWNEDKKPLHKETSYFTKSSLKAVTLRGQVAYYFGGGYVQKLSYDREHNGNTIAHLRDIQWIDRGTRVVILEFVLYNSNAYMFENVKILAEIPPVGGIVTSAQLQALKLSIWMEGNIIFYIAAGVFYFMAILYTIEEILEITSKGCRDYISSLWNILDISVLVLIYASFIYNIVNTIMLKKLLQKAKENQTEYLSIDVLCFMNYIYIDMMAICIFLIWFKIFKYISFNKTMIHISTTISRCAADLFGFIVMFFIIFIAYAQLGLLLFGTTHPDFRTFTKSIITLMRMFLGDFEYAKLEEANYILGPIYFITYVMLVFFILLNMFLAVVNDTYVVVKGELDKGDSHLGTYMTKIWRNFMHRVFGRKYKDKDTSAKTSELAKMGGHPELRDIYGQKIDEITGLPIAEGESDVYKKGSRSMLTLKGILKEYFEEIRLSERERLRKQQLGESGSLPDVSSSELELYEPEQKQVGPPGLTGPSDLAAPSGPSGVPYPSGPSRLPALMHITDDDDDITRLRKRVAFLEDRLEALIAKMDIILQKVEAKKHLKKYKLQDKTE